MRMVLMMMCLRHAHRSPHHHGILMHALLFHMNPSWEHVNFTRQGGPSQAMDIQTRNLVMSYVSIGLPTYMCTCVHKYQFDAYRLPMAFISGHELDNASISIRSSMALLD
jgi:hypothetical protein